MSASFFSRFVALPTATFSAVVVLGMFVLAKDHREDERPLMEREVAHPDLSADDVRSIIPSDWEVVTSRCHPGGWQQMGTVRGSVVETCDSVSSLMEAHGYALMRSVSNSNGTDGGLFSYGNAGGSGRVLWSLWPAGHGCTGFAWGIER